MTHRENMLRAIRFESPEYIPMVFHINPACWHHYDQEMLKDFMESHPILFPGYIRPKGEIKPAYALNARSQAAYTDPWRCTWQTTDNGITGSVHDHPLSDWAGLKSYTPPDPGKTDGTFPLDWGKIETEVEQRRAEGKFVSGELPHGHTFLRLQDIRGYENLLIDMIDHEPRLSRLIAMVEEFNLEYVRRWMRLKPDMMSYPEDLGMQVGPMLSPDCFREYIKPVYQRLMKPARDFGCIVHMHSDGDIRMLVDDLIDGGVDVINLQDLVNGIEWIADKFAGHVCVDLDIDRQSVTAQGTPSQIDALIRKEVELLGSRRGGLMMIYGLYPGVPVDNIRALMDAMEKYAAHFS